MDHLISNSNLPIIDNKSRENLEAVISPVASPNNVPGSVDRVIHHANSVDSKDQRKINLTNSIRSGSTPLLARSLKKNVPRRRLRKIKSQFGDKVAESILEFGSVKIISDRHNELVPNKFRSEFLKPEKMTIDQMDFNLTSPSIQSKIGDTSTIIGSGSEANFKSGGNLKSVDPIAGGSQSVDRNISLNQGINVSTNTDGFSLNSGSESGRIHLSTNHI
ncbi:hypothetical protein L6452_32028 [Arctium lappa]|uniref:Uncharacterized protein n=1 Tax=Arctium lappa TaxID=4217 RepID=A0ACB8Z3T9_ARCLA|nr:hypothetical protein L6452_32028 [Arctium lappa]